MPSESWQGVERMIVMLPESWQGVERMIASGADLTGLFYSLAIVRNRHTNCQRCGLILIDARALAVEIVGDFDLDPEVEVAAVGTLEAEIDESGVEIAGPWPALCSCCEDAFAPR